MILKSYPSNHFRVWNCKTGIEQQPPLLRFLKLKFKEVSPAGQALRFAHVYLQSINGLRILGNRFCRWKNEPWTESVWKDKCKINLWICYFFSQKMYQIIHYLSTKIRFKGYGFELSKRPPKLRKFFFKPYLFFLEIHETSS